MDRAIDRMLTRICFKALSGTLKSVSKKGFVLAALIAMGFGLSSAGEKDSRIGIGMGILYDKGLEATISYEVEGGNHHAWEFFANGYLQWDECKSDNHVCPQSFWHGERNWLIGAAYKPCVVRGKNHYGSLRIGASAGSNLHKFIGAAHLGYEHNYRLKGGWQFFWQAKADVVIKSGDLIRPGIALGIKFPI